MQKEYWRNQNISSFVTAKFNEKQPVGKPIFKPKFITLDFDPDTVTKIEALGRRNANTSLNCLLALLADITLASYKTI